MKKTPHCHFAVMLLFLLSACSKIDNSYQSTAIIYTIHAAAGTGALKVNPGATTGFAYAKAEALAFGTMALYGNFPGSKTFSIVNALDTTKTILRSTLNLKSINSLYIVGQSPNIDTIFRAEDNFPSIQSATLTPDSSIYLRFVNLSPNSTPVKVNIRSAISNEVVDLGYRGISEFKKYKALAATSNYIFEIRDVSSNAILTTYTLTVSSARFKTIALVIKGLKGTTTGADAFGIFQVNYT